MPTNEFVSSAARVSRRAARSLVGALRDHALDLPDNEETRAEFLTTRMVETGPGTVKTQNPPGTHDDILTAVGVVVADLTERPDIRAGNDHGSHGGGARAGLAAAPQDADPCAPAAARTASAKASTVSCLGAETAHPGPDAYGTSNVASSESCCA